MTYWEGILLLSSHTFFLSPTHRKRSRCLGERFVFTKNGAGLAWGRFINLLHAQIKLGLLRVLVKELTSLRNTFSPPSVCSLHVIHF